MENWIGIGIWIIMGGLIGLIMRTIVKRPHATPGHTGLIVVLGAFAAVVGGMLGVGIFAFEHPRALTIGGTMGAIGLAGLFTFIYRWGIKGLT